MTLIDEGYLLRRPGIQGSLAEGETIEDAMFSCLDVVNMIAAYRREHRES